MREKKSNSALFILLGILFILLVGALLFTLKTFNIEIPLFKSQSGTIKNALNENNYQAAYTLYAETGKTQAETEIIYEHLNEYFALCESEEYTNNAWTCYRGIEVFNAEIKEAVLDKMDEIVSRYYGNEITENDAKNYLSRISKFSFASEKYEECVLQIGKKDSSDKAYLEGIELYNQGKIEEAVKAFKKVSTMDTERYPLALDAIERCKNEWGSIKIQEAQKMIDAYNKEGARDLLEKLLNIFGEYQEAENLILTLDNQTTYLQ